ncbi:MAG: thiamine phosphate synthase [Pseudomonadota bacterium]
MKTSAEIYLIADTGSAAHARVAAILARVKPSSLLVRKPSDAPEFELDATRDIIAASQEAGIAALIESNAELARGLRADGVHLSQPNADKQAYAEAREIVGGRAIVGLTAGPLRHDAMEAGELGADYVAFARVPGDDGFETLIERVAWWSEIFELPCVALGAETTDEMVALTEAGADFIGVQCPVATSVADAVDYVVDAQTAILSARGHAS